LLLSENEPFAIQFNSDAADVIDSFVSIQPSTVIAGFNGTGLYNTNTLLSSNTKFEVYLELLIDLESAESIQIKLDQLSSNIFFYGNETRIREYSEKDIDAIVNILKRYQTIRVLIQGWHNTSSPRVRPGEPRIDVARANSIKDMLVSKGIDESRITAEGKGESTVVPDDTEKNQFGDDWNKNMRVDIKIVK
jgi:outer membrane protein OmpA-like peptidoglycan-associated protein